MNTVEELTQEDPIIMYLIVRESLNMTLGKTAAQCAHASQMLTMSHFTYNDKLSFMSSEAYENYLANKELFDKWLNSSYRKVILKADEKEWRKIKESFPTYTRSVVVDAGLTELEPNTETVIGLMPMRKSNAPKLIKRLQLLK
jgi:PTH2 family peptidyl-tRNA hydrolase